MMVEAPQARVLLLVEDNPADAELVRGFLSPDAREAYQIVHVPSVADAVDRLASLKVDVVVLDLGLPDCQGIDAVRLLRKCAGRGTPIVVLTGTEDEEVALACIDAGVQDYLSKAETRARNLRRSIGYAITRLRETQLQELQELLERYRELSSRDQGTTVTAALAGSGAIAERYPDLFAGIVERYLALLQQHLDGGDNHGLRPAMEGLVTELGDRSAGPRDLLDVHVAALDAAVAERGGTMSASAMLEGRLVALQMMGMLVEYYRVGHRRRFGGTQ